MKILHLFPWTLAFTDCVIQMFERTRHCNEYVCFIHEDDNRGSSSAKERTTQLSPESMLQRCMDSDADIFMFHSLPEAFYDCVLSIPEDRIVIASIWGYDIYEPQSGCRPVCPLPLLKPETEKVVKALNRSRTSALRLFMIFCKRLLLYPKRFFLSIKAQKKQDKTLERVDYWATVLPTEYDMLKKNPAVRGEYFPFQYTGFETIAQRPSKSTKGDTILVGNSATPSNNHIDILNIFHKRNITNPVYLPMAYGKKAYMQEVEKTAGRTVRNHFIQDVFLPGEEYDRIFNDCSAAIFGHIRQQGLGNVAISVFHGMKVYFWRDSVAYLYLKSKGCHVFTIEEDFTKESVAHPLSEDQIAFNRNIVSDLLSADRVLSEMNAVLDSMEHGRTGNVA